MSNNLILRVMLSQMTNYNRDGRKIATLTGTVVFHLSRIIVYVHRRVAHSEAATIASVRLEDILTSIDRFSGHFVDKIRDLPITFSFNFIGFFEYSN